MKIKHTLSRIQEKSLEDTLAIQTKTHNTVAMNKFILAELAKMDGVITKVDNGNIYATKGESKTYPCIAAHTDTVHDIVENFHIFHLDDVLFSLDTKTMERCGIGGDDKVGVFIALEVIKTLDVCKVAFFQG